VNEAASIETLGRGHRLDDFDRGREPLGQFLVRRASQSRRAGASRTYVALVGALQAAGEFESDEQGRRHGPSLGKQ
jgi:hypothetical protein